MSNHTAAEVKSTQKKPFGRRVWEFVKSWGTVILIVLAIRAFVIEAFTVPTGSMEETIMPGDFLLVNKFVYGFKIPFTTTDLIAGRLPRRGEIIVFRYPQAPRWPQPEERYARFFPKWFPLLPLYWDRWEKRFHWYSPPNYVKRCIGLPGDTVQIVNKVVYVNGEPLNDSAYTIHKWPDVFYHDVSQEAFNERWRDLEFMHTREIRDNFGPIIVPQNHVFGMGDNRDESDDCRFWGPIPVSYLKGKPLVIYYSLGDPYDESGRPVNLLVRIFKTKWNRIGRVVR